jgi:hypothetical protein
VNPVTTLFSAAVLSCLIATGASGQTAEAPLSDVGRALVVSSNLRLSGDTERSSGGVPTLVKQFLVPYAGAVRLTFQLKSSNAAQDATAIVSSQIDSRCIKKTKLLAYVNFTCTIRVVAGDIVEVRVQGSFSPSTGFVKNARVFYNVVDSSGLGKTLLN